MALLIAWAACGEVRADSTAYFWLSNVNAGPAAPVIYALPGAAGNIDVWARPAVDYRLAAFSLDLQAHTPGVVALTGVEVVNPQLDDKPELHRHQIIFDSESGLFVTDDEIYGFLGYSFFDDVMGLPNGAGIGPMCGIDPECSGTSGAPTWRIATVHYQAGLSLGSTELFLAIGEQGLWQFEPNSNPHQSPDETSAVFGLMDDAVNQWDVDYLMEPPDNDIDHRHEPQGLADAVIQVASADFDEDGDVDGADLLAWQRGVGVGDSHSEGDANGDSQVNAVDLAAWRFQFGATGVVAPAGSAVPEPTGACALAALAAVSFHRHRRRAITRPA